MIRQLAGLVVAAGLMMLVLAAVLWSTPVRAAQCGRASFYAEAHHGKIMSNNKPFDMWAMTVASNSLPLGSRARVWVEGKSHNPIVVTITDRGGFGKYGRILDLSKGAFAKLANPDRGVISICISAL